MRKRSPVINVLILLACALGTVSAQASHPSVVLLGGRGAAAPWASTNGVLEAVPNGAGDAAWRWLPNPGQSATLHLRPDQPVFGALRYYDHLQFRFRVASGSIRSFALRALGHVSGARAYKQHQWNLALGSTPTNTWHERDIDLSRPNWLVWDNPDGEGSLGYFVLECLSDEPGTVVELAGLRLVRSALIVKPLYEFPVSWPVKTLRDDGSVVYRLTVRVLNADGAPATVTGRILSRHERFRVTLGTNAVSAKAGQVVAFPVEAAISREEAARGAELESELLRLAFAASSLPEVETTFEVPLVRPLSPGLRRQVILAEADLRVLRDGLAADDAGLQKAVDEARVIAGADAFLDKALLQIPPGHQWPGSNPGTDWVVADAMPAIVNKKTGEKECGTSLAGLVWKRHLGYPGLATENLGLAYLFTGDERYAAKALELFRLYARQYRELPWGPGMELPWLAGPSLQTSSRMASSSTYGSNMFMKHPLRLLSMVAESPTWTPADWANVYTNFAIPYAAELAKSYSGIHNQTDISSHNLALLGLVFDDALMLHQAVMADAGLLARIRDIDADGFSSEGRPITYHFAGMAEYLPAVEYLANAGVRLPVDVQRLLQAMRMPYRRATLTGAVPSSGDCARGYRAASQPLAGHLVSLFPKERWLLDISGKGTLASRIRAHVAGQKSDPDAWRGLLETAPTLFAQAGFAILRTGDTADAQILATLDYGRAAQHVGANRNQIAVAAFGALLSHDPGSLYNIGSGGMTRTRDAKLDTFALNHTVGFNVVAVDAQDQSPAIGELLAWSAAPAFQVAVSRVRGAYPGVSHTRALVLTEGLVVVLDRLASDGERTFDFIYHNLGTLTAGPGWTEQPTDEPLGRTANYENIQRLVRLRGTGPIRLTWDIAAQLPADAPARATGAALDLWQLPVAAGEVYCGVTGLNNPNTKTFPDTAPTLFHRVRGGAAAFATVLEPRRGAARVRSIEPLGDAGVAVQFQDGHTVRIELDALLAAHALPARGR